jgi:uncharacterized protein
VHQDGLVHVSQLSTRFIKDPSEAVKVGDRLTVKVLTVDLVRKRLALSVRAVTEGTSAPSVGAPRSSGSEARPTAGGARPPPAGKPGGGKAPASQKPSAEPFNNPFRNLKR